LRLASPAVVLAAIALASACGKSVVPADRFETPMYSFSGNIVPPGGIPVEKSAKARIGVLWTDPFQRKPDVPMPAHYISSTFDPESDAGADHYTVSLYRPPPPEAMFDIESKEKKIARLAVGEIVLFYDEDGDGTFSVAGPRAKIGGKDEYLAASKFILRYVADPFPPSEQTFPLGRTHNVGYDMVSLVCEGRTPARPPRAGFATANRFEALEMVLQPSVDSLPEVRTCMRLHSN
jgi:hypothetical protein